MSTSIIIPGGSFSEEGHLYRDESGAFIPSLTQVLKLQGLSDYGGIDPEVLANAARRGSEVHALAAAYNAYGECDPSWITEETQPYFDAYMDFLRDTHFKPDPAWVECAMIATIRGRKVGVTPDCYGKLGRDNAIVELKCTAAPQPSWSIQTCIQEFAIFNSAHCGRVKRFALMLMKTRKYKLLEHTDHLEDETNALAALQNVYWRLAKGQDLRRMLTA